MNEAQRSECRVERLVIKPCSKVAIKSAKAMSLDDCIGRLELTTCGETINEFDCVAIHKLLARNRELEAALRKAHNAIQFLGAVL